MARKTVSRTQRGTPRSLIPGVALLLGASALPAAAFAATGNVDIYGIINVSVSQFSGADSTLVDSGATAAQAGFAVANLALSGAHHRTLLDMGIAPGETGTCAWVTADAARQNSADFSEELVEAGVCKDVGSARWGVGVGQAWSRQDRILGGKTAFDGQYLLAEVANDFRNGLQGSLTAFYGRFDTRLRRNYINGGVDSSTGRPDADSIALRVRLDWKNAAKLGAFALSPYAAYTWTETELDAYTETGGGLPQAFYGATWRVSEVRVGTAATRAVSADTDLRLSLTLAHRFDSNTGSIAGPSFNAVGHFQEQTRGIATVDVDHRLSRSTALTFGASASGSDDGDSWGWGVTAGLRAGF